MSEAANSVKRNAIEDVLAINEGGDKEDVLTDSLTEQQLDTPEHSGSKESTTDLNNSIIDSKQPNVAEYLDSNKSTLDSIENDDQNDTDEVKCTQKDQESVDKTQIIPKMKSTKMSLKDDKLTVSEISKSELVPIRLNDHMKPSTQHILQMDNRENQASRHMTTEHNRDDYKLDVPRTSTRNSGIIDEQRIPQHKPIQSNIIPPGFEPITYRQDRPGPKVYSHYDTHARLDKQYSRAAPLYNSSYQASLQPSLREMRMIKDEHSDHSSTHSSTGPSSQRGTRRDNGHTSSGYSPKYHPHSNTSGHHSNTSGLSYPGSKSTNSRASTLNKVCNNMANVSTLSEVVCRICHEGDMSELLVSPCYCAGTMGLLHVSCLQKWLGSSNKTTCEICHFLFALERKPKPLSQFVRDPGTRRDRRNLICDILSFMLITPLTVITTWLCIEGAVRYYGKDEWERGGLIGLSCSLLTLYLVWLIVALRHNWRLYRDWQMFHQDVTLVCKPQPANGKANTNSPLPSGSIGSRSTTAPSIQLQSIKISVQGPMMHYKPNKGRDTTPPKLSREKYEKSSVKSKQHQPMHGSDRESNHTAKTSSDGSRNIQDNKWPKPFPENSMGTRQKAYTESDGNMTDKQNMSSLSQFRSPRGSDGPRVINTRKNIYYADSIGKCVKNSRKPDFDNEFNKRVEQSSTNVSPRIPRSVSLGRSQGRQFIEMGQLQKPQVDQQNTQQMFFTRQNYNLDQSNDHIQSHDLNADSSLAIFSRGNSPIKEQHVNSGEGFAESYTREWVDRRVQGAGTEINGKSLTERAGPSDWRGGYNESRRKETIIGIRREESSKDMDNNHNSCTCDKYGARF